MPLSLVKYGQLAILEFCHYMYVHYSNLIQVAPQSRQHTENCAIMNFTIKWQIYHKWKYINVYILKKCLSKRNIHLFKHKAEMDNAIWGEKEAYLDKLNLLIPTSIKSNMCIILIFDWVMHILIQTWSKDWRHSW